MSSVTQRRASRVSERSYNNRHPSGTLFDVGIPVPIQAKLAVGAVDSPLEHEADVLAERVVSDMHRAAVGASIESAVLRDAPASEKESIQRKCDACTDLEEEQATVQRKAMANVTSAASDSSSFAMQLRQARRGGRPLEAKLRLPMEKGFGVDFSHVRLHTDDRAAQVAQRLNARAFTVGSEVFFNRGELRPTERAGQMLIAHELTHVVQQGAASRRADAQTDRSASTSPTSSVHQSTIQRKVIVGKKPLPAVESSQFANFLLRHDLEGLTEIITGMHESVGVVRYETIEDLEMDAKIRNRMNLNMQGVESRLKRVRQSQWNYDVYQQAVRLACCAYPHPDFQANNYYLDPERWTPLKNKAQDGTFLAEGQSREANFVMKPGQDGALAVSHLFKPNATTPGGWSRLDCAGMLTAVHYKALLDVLGAEVFNSMLASGLRIVGFNPQDGAGKHPLVEAGLFERVLIPFEAADPTKYLVPGDRVYFQNNVHMKDCDVTSIWRGEHALYLGDGMFTGFGVGREISYDQMIANLFSTIRRACTKLEKTEGAKTPEQAKAIAVVSSSSFAEKDIPGLKNTGPFDINIRKEEESVGVEVAARLGPELSAMKNVFVEATAVWRLNPRRLRRFLEAKLGSSK